jgi:hypothetical protein
MYFVEEEVLFLLFVAKLLGEKIDAFYLPPT